MRKPVLVPPPRSVDPVVAAEEAWAKLEKLWAEELEEPQAKNTSLNGSKKEQLPPAPKWSPPGALPAAASTSPSWSPASASSAPFSAQNVLLGEAVAERIKSLNSGLLLRAKIDTHAVVEPLSKLDVDTALEILDGLQERGRQVDDPTAWIIEAAGAIPQMQPAWTKDAEEGKDLEEEVDLERPAKLKRTARNGPVNLEVTDDIEDVADEEVESPQVGAQAEAAGEGTERAEAAAATPLHARPAAKGFSKGTFIRPIFQPSTLPGGMMRRYKTDLCRRFQLGMCPSGPSCNFAHGPAELRPGYAQPHLVPPRAVAPLLVQPLPWSQKTVLCTQFLGGLCEAGEQCRFAHGDQQMRLARIQTAYKLGHSVEEEPPSLETGQELTMEQICNYKTRLCHRFMVGFCKLDSDCLLAHGESELRQPWKVPDLDDVATLEQAEEDFVSEADKDVAQAVEMEKKETEHIK